MNLKCTLIASLTDGAEGEREGGDGAAIPVGEDAAEGEVVSGAGVAEVEEGDGRRGWRHRQRRRSWCKGGLGRRKGAS
jgi:hypothetical protein